MITALAARVENEIVRDVGRAAEAVIEIDRRARAIENDLRGDNMLDTREGGKHVLTFFSMTLWQLFAWNHIELCFSMSPISRT